MVNKQISPAFKKILHDLWDMKPQKLKEKMKKAKLKAEVGV